MDRERPAPQPAGPGEVPRAACPRRQPVIGHLKDHHRMGRNYFAHASGDAISALLAAAGYNFRRLLAWLRLFVAQNP